jgi:hypothetical protein
MNKKTIIFAISLWGLILCTFLINVTIRVSKAVISTISYAKTEQVLDTIRLKEISERIGVEPSWLSFRDYIYCKSLHKGMSREEVENILSKIGEIDVTNYQIAFKDLYTNTKLGPVVLIFENDKLIKWRRSPYENFGQKLAECEKDQ